MHSIKALEFSCGECGSRMRPSNLQSDALPTKLSLLRSNARLDIRVAYINFLPCLTLKEVELNSEYHAPRQYRFMVSFLLVQNHEQLYNTFRGVWILVEHSRSSTIFGICYIRTTLFSLKYISI